MNDTGGSTAPGKGYTDAATQGTRSAPGTEEAPNTGGRAVPDERRFRADERAEQLQGGERTEEHATTSPEPPGITDAAQAQEDD